MRKIIALRSAGRDGGAGWRYVSKNNANMMRAPLLSAAFPDCRIVLPLRRPLDHAVSLWRQHRNFLNHHTEDPFAKRYMADIGHFEFGALHKPFDAPGLDEMIEGRTPDDLDYWLAYWIAVYEYIEADLRARSPENVIVVDPALLRRAPRKALAHLCAALNLPGDEGLDAAAAVITPERTPVDPEVNPNLRERAETVYEAMLSRALG